MNFSKDFPIINKYHYLDNAASSLKPKQVVDKMSEYYLEYGVNVHRGIYKLSEIATNEYEKTREMCSDFFNSKINEIIFTKGTTESLNLLSYSLSKSYLKKGDYVMLTNMEHHSNIVPWLVIKEYLGIKLEFANVKDSELDYENFEKIVKEKKPKIVSVAHVSNILGTINNVKKISKLCKDLGIIFIIDAAQSAPHIGIDFKDIDCSFIALSAHKMLGPNGLGILIGKEELLDDIPPFISGGNMIKEVKKDKFTCANLPNKFEAGTPNISGVIGFSEALKYIRKIGYDFIHDNDKSLIRYAQKKSKDYDFLNIHSNTKLEHNTSIFTFSINGIHSHDISEILNEYDVCVRSGQHCSQILHESMGVKNTTRASFYFYNRKEDVDRLFDGIEKVKSVFKI